MTPKPLNFLFDAMHHRKHRFEDFLAIDVAANYEPIGWADRTIYRPTKLLKTFQSFLNSVLFEHLPTNERVSFAYRKGTTLRQAVEAHASSRAFFQADFEKFFHSLDSDLIRTTVLAHETPVEDVATHLDHILNLTTIDGRLPIGFVTSPTISNACLKVFDDYLEAACKGRELIYSRYADDIVISAPDRDALDGIDTVVSQIAQERIHPRLTLNSAKSKLTTVGRRVRILGFDVLPNGRITISRELRQKVEVLIHFLVADRAKFAQFNEGDIEKGLQKLGGYISHIHAADPEYLAKLRRKFGTTTIDSLLHRSLGDESN